MEWTKIKDGLPPRAVGESYSQVPCLVVRDGEIGILVFNHEHMVWDDASGDDFECQIAEVSHWMALSNLPKVPT